MRHNLIQVVIGMKYTTDMMAGASSVLEVADEEFLCALLARRPPGGTHLPPLFEYMPEDSVRRCYFDIDGQYEDLDHKLSVHNYLAQYTNQFLHDIDASFKIATICISEDASNKCSIHVTCNFSASPADNARLCRQLNTVLSKEFIWNDIKVDPAVYGKTQKLRCLYSCKRDSSRKKLLLFGAESDTLITFKAHELPVYRNQLPAQVAYNPGCFTLPKLKWLCTVLAMPSLRPMWRLAATAYDQWFLVGRSIYIEVAKQFSRDDGLGLFQYFSSFAGDRYDAAECAAKYARDFVNCKSKGWAKIKQWVENADPTMKNSAMDLLYRGKDTASPDPLADFIDFDDSEAAKFEKEEPFTFEARSCYEYVLVQHINHSKTMKTFWHQQLSHSTDHLRGFLLHPDLALVNYAEKMTYCKKLYGSSFSPSMQPFPELTTGIQFVKAIYAYFDLPMNDDTALDIIKPLPKEEKNSKKAPAPVTGYNPSPAAVCRLYAHYIDICSELDGDGTYDALEAVAKQILPLAREEWADPRRRILDIVSGPCRWTTERPYHRYFCELFEAAGHDENIMMLLLAETANSRLLAERQFHFITSVYSDYSAVQAVLSLYPFWIADDGSIVQAFDAVSGMYSSEEPHVRMIINRLSCFLQDPPSVGHDFSDGGDNYALNFNRLDKLYKALTTNAQVIRDGNLFYKEYSKTGREKFLFRNGIWDGIRGIFEKRGTYTVANKHYLMFSNHKMMFFGSIPFDFLEYTTPEHEQMMVDMEKKLFTDMHGEANGKYWKESLAKKLAGINTKELDFHVGETDSGKSTIKAMIEDSFGSYVRTGQLGWYAYHKNASQDSELRNKFVVPNAHVRLLLYSESIEGLVDTEMIKSHSAGAGLDKIIARPLHGNIKTFQPEYNHVFFLNSMPKFTNEKDKALRNRISIFTYYKRFVELAALVDPGCQILIDETVKDWHGDLLRKQLFVRMMINSHLEYRVRGKALPIPAPLLADRLLDEPIQVVQMDVLENILCSVIITGNDSDYISVDDFAKICEKYQYEHKTTRNKLNRLFQDHQLFPFKAMQKRVGGTRVSVITGMRGRAFVENFNDGMPEETDILLEGGQLIKVLKQGVIDKAVLSSLQRARRICCSMTPLTDEDRDHLFVWASKGQLAYLAKYHPHERAFRQESL